MIFDADLMTLRTGLLPVPITDDADKTQRDGQRMAAVLIPLILRAEGWNIVLTQRPETMPSHPGQVAFPGGKHEIGERVRDTALRETDEEIGVPPAQIELIGRLLSFNAVSKFRVTPYVGIVAPDAVFKPDPREVADVFEVPLAFLMNESNHVRRDVFFDGKDHVLWDMPYTGADGIYRNIWGMTAMTLYRLYQRAYCGIFETEFTG